ncbi:MAG: hypothetical protein RI885_751 [Actinomycetota bacterium]|jgi:hypothetical protein
MSMFSKLAGLAHKALSESGSGQKPGSGQRPGGGQTTDWRAMVRTAADALTGDGRTDPAQGRDQAPAPSQTARDHGARSAAAPLSDADRAAIARYDYLLQTADPHQIEQVHREAFHRLTPAQRELIHERMSAELPEHERPRSSGTDDLARTAARTEAARPGMLKGLLARVGAGTSRGGSAGSGAGRAALIGGAGLAAGGLLGAVAGGAIVSSVAGPLLAQAMDFGVDFEALGAGLDIESLGLDGLTGGVDELASTAGDSVSGFGDQISELGSDFRLPGLDDLFGR